MLWRKLYEKIGKQPLKLTQHEDVKVVVDDKEYLVTGLYYESGHLNHLRVVAMADKEINGVPDKTIPPARSLSQVYVLLAVYDMHDCVDNNGEDAGEQEEIKSVFATMKQAEKRKRELDADNDMNECDCDPVWYKSFRGMSSRRMRFKHRHSGIRMSIYLLADMLLHYCIR